MKITFNDCEPKYFEALNSLVFESYTKEGYGTKKVVLVNVQVSKYGLSLEFFNDDSYEDNREIYASNEITPVFFHTLETWCAKHGLVVEYVRSGSDRHYQPNLFAYVTEQN